MISVIPKSKLMRILQFFTLIFGILSLGGCKDVETQSFSQIVNAFGMTIPDHPCTYVVIPIHSCTICVKQTWTILENGTNLSKNITIIDAFHSGKDPFVRTVNFPVYIDSTYIIEDNPVSFSNPTIVHTANGKVKSIVSVPTNRVEETIREQLNDDH